MKFLDQKVSRGSSHISQKLQFEKDKYMLENMQYNMAFIYELKNLNKKNENQISSADKDKLLTQFQLKYKNYRKIWLISTN